MKKYILLLSCLLISLDVLAAANNLHPKNVRWSFDGIFGTFDRQAIQRGFQVYKEVCSTCHAINLLSYRNLRDIGFSEDEVKSLAADYQVPDLDENGELTTRKGLPSDRIVAPYPNEKAARAANNGAYPPNLSLIVKAREDGANYLYSLLTGYHTPPERMVVPNGQYYNPYFANIFIAMPPPLANDDMVQYIDGTKATIDQMARDVVHFLQWAAEPEMETRKRMGLKALMYLLILTVVFVLAKKEIWSRLKKD